MPSIVLYKPRNDNDGGKDGLNKDDRFGRACKAQN